MQKIIKNLLRKKIQGQVKAKKVRKKCFAILAFGNCRKDIFFFKDFAPKEQRSTVLRTGTRPLFHRLINYTDTKAFVGFS
jgi:hypothetical protein